MRNTSAILLAFLLLAPAVASAQVSTLSVTANPTTFGVGDCTKTFTFTITAKDAQNAGVPNLQNSARWVLTVANNSKCTDGGEVDASITATGATGGYQVKLTGEELLSLGLNQNNCSTASVDETLFFCAGFDNETIADPNVASAQVAVDTVPAGAPVLDSVKPGDGRLYLHFTPAEGEDSPDNWRVCFRPAGGGTGGTGGAGGTGGTDTDVAGLDGDAGAGGDAGLGGTDAGLGGTDVAGGGTGGDVGTAGTGGVGGEGGLAGTGGIGGEGGTAGTGGTAGSGGTGGSTGGGVVSDICSSSGGGKRSQRISGLKRNFTLDGLRNGVTYEVAVQAIDTNGSESNPSNVMTGTPVPTADFIDLYRDAGGDEGGCSAGGGSMLLGLLAAGFFFANRQGRR